MTTSFEVPSRKFVGADLCVVSLIRSKPLQYIEDRAPAERGRALEAAANDRYVRTVATGVGHSAFSAGNDATLTCATQEFATQRAVHAAAAADPRPETHTRAGDFAEHSSCRLYGRG